MTRENQIFAYAKAKAQIIFTVTAKLISAFVFATWIVPFLFFLNLKFQASCQLLCLQRPVCVISGRKPQRPIFSHCGSYVVKQFCELAWSKALRLHLIIKVRQANNELKEDKYELIHKYWGIITVDAWIGHVGPS